MTVDGNHLPNRREQTATWVSGLVLGVSSLLSADGTFRSPDRQRGSSGTGSAIPRWRGWSQAAAARPGTVGLLRELSAVPEFAAFVARVSSLVANAPRGDGHPVLVLPGFGTGDTSTRPLRWMLDRPGYATLGWGLGPNIGLRRDVHQTLAERLIGLAELHRRSVSLIGWSIGGIHAMALTQRSPGLVRRIITLGSPLARSCVWSDAKNRC